MLFRCGQSNKDREFKFILVHQDHMTKFINLKALKTKTAAEVAYNLIDIFCLFGAPSTLQSDNGREFVNSIITEVETMWKGLKIVHGKPRHSQSQGSVERANQDVERMLYAWMEENGTSKWTEGLRFVQLQKNNALHSGIEQSPYEALFGRPAPFGLASSQLPERLQTLTEEEEITEEIEEAVQVDSSSEADQLEESRSKIRACRRKAVEGLERQAKKMKTLSEKAFPPLVIGTNVKIPVPQVDRGKVDANNLIGVILSITEDEFYRVGTREGTISRLFARNQIFPCKESFLSADEVPDKEYTVRSLSLRSSLTGGQGFFFCQCKTKCTSNRCKCKSNNVLCNSKCHSSSDCNNK